MRKVQVGAEEIPHQTCRGVDPGHTEAITGLASTLITLTVMVQSMAATTHPQTLEISIQVTASGPAMVHPGGGDVVPGDEGITGALGTEVAQEGVLKEASKKTCFIVSLEFTKHVIIVVG